MPVLDKESWDEIQRLKRRLRDAEAVIEACAKMQETMIRWTQYMGDEHQKIWIDAMYAVRVWREAGD